MANLSLSFRRWWKWSPSSVKVFQPPTSSPEPRALSSPVPESCPPPLQPDANEVLSFLQWLASGLCVYRQTLAAMKPWDSEVKQSHIFIVLDKQGEVPLLSLLLAPSTSQPTSWMLLLACLPSAGSLFVHTSPSRRFIQTFVWTSEGQAASL